MGGVSKVLSKAPGKLFGQVSGVKVPETPDLEKEREKAEEAAIRKRAALADKGMSGTVLGGSYGDDGNVKRKKLLGE
ncbi:MAG: hypothetical protein LIP28_06840 [Deltaproteobacteria bacterium]|nr:hypothetical protein [Deltaproteobacteria bacterium]